jgi:hypothetical protein
MCAGHLLDQDRKALGLRAGPGDDVQHGYVSEAAVVEELGLSVTRTSPGTQK